MIIPIAAIFGYLACGFVALVYAHKIGETDETALVFILWPICIMIHIGRQIDHLAERIANVL